MPIASLLGTSCNPNRPMSRMTAAIDDAHAGAPGPGAGQVARALRYALQPALEMRAARQLKRDLQAVLASRGPCLIEAEAVERVSTACVQILAAFFEAAKRDGIAVILLRPSQALVESLDALGLSVVRKQWNVES
jgi:chemotaxis protein CheX